MQDALEEVVMRGDVDRLGIGAGTIYTPLAQGYDAPEDPDDGTGHTEEGKHGARTSH